MGIANSELDDAIQCPCTNDDTLRINRGYYHPRLSVRTSHSLVCAPPRYAFFSDIFIIEYDSWNVKRFFQEEKTIQPCPLHGACHGTTGHCVALQALHKCLVSDYSSQLPPPISRAPRRRRGKCTHPISHPLTVNSKCVTLDSNERSPKHDRPRQDHRCPRQQPTQSACAAPSSCQLTPGS